MPLTSLQNKKDLLSTLLKQAQHTYTITKQQLQRIITLAPDS